MSKSVHHQSGIALMGIILLVVVAGGIAGVGFLIFSQKNKSAPVTSETTLTSPQSANKATTPASTPSAATGTMLTIKEWGIQMPLPDALKDAYVVPLVTASTGKSTDPPSFMWIGLKALDGMGCQAEKGNTGSPGVPIAAFNRSKPGATEPIHGTPYTQLYPDGITINGYYYAYVSRAGISTCAPAASLKPIDTAFSSSIRKATAVTTASASQ